MSWFNDLFKKLTCKHKWNDGIKSINFSNSVYDWNILCCCRKCGKFKKVRI